MKSLSLCSCLLLAAAWAPQAARAEQFLLLDLTYEATAQNTSDSHYPAMPAAGIPTNWRSPINYANGTAYVRFEVLSAPSATKTLYNICFENSAASCMGYPPPYSGKGVTNFSGAFSSFWNYSAVDWSKGVSKVSLILKDEAGNKVQGNPQFYPYKMHVQITIVAPGSTYVPPDATGMTPTAGSGGNGGGSASGSGGAGGARAGSGGAGSGGMGEAGRASGAAGMPSAGTGGGAGAAAPVKDAGMGEDDPVVVDAAVADAASGTPVDEGARPAKPGGPKKLDPQPQEIDKRAPPPGDLDGGCAVGGNGSVSAWALAAISGMALRVRRRRRR
ncbi:MAG TPA: hypothetical protein VJR89_25770 [Polyangiales bacterium]|nr:hypothetical protein [Polyangiales bacterium]